jgi:hypothetical protein
MRSAAVRTERQRNNNPSRVHDSVNNPRLRSLGSCFPKESFISLSVPPLGFRITRWDESSTPKGNPRQSRA